MQLLFLDVSSKSDENKLRIISSAIVQLLPSMLLYVDIANIYVESENAFHPFDMYIIIALLILILNAHFRIVVSFASANKLCLEKIRQKSSFRIDCSKLNVFPVNNQL